MFAVWEEHWWNQTAKLSQSWWQQHYVITHCYGFVSPVISTICYGFVSYGAWNGTQVKVPNDLHNAIFLFHIILLHFHTAWEQEWNKDVWRLGCINMILVAFFVCCISCEQWVACATLWMELGGMKIKKCPARSLITRYLYAPKELLTEPITNDVISAMPVPPGC